MSKLFTIFTIVFALSFIAGLNVNAQDAPISIGLAPLVYNTVEQSVVFDGPLPTSRGFSVDAASLTSSQVFKYFLGTPGTSTNVGAISANFLGSGDFGGPSNLLYMISQVSPYVLYSVDTTTGVRTTVATITGINPGHSAGGITSCAWDQTTNTMFIESTAITSSQLYSLNLTSGVATPIGGLITNAPGIIALACNTTGQLYAIDIVNDNLWSINKTTGAATLVGALGYNANYGQDADFDPHDDVLYWAAIGTGLTQLRTINTTTGMSALVGNFTGKNQVLATGIPGAGTTYAHDYAAGPFLSLPVQFVKNNPYPIKAKITNLGTSAETGVPIAFFVNGAQQTSVNLSLAAGANDSVSYTWTPTTAGTYNLKWISRLGTDQNKANDTVQTSVTVLNSAIVNVFCDNFSAGTSNWVITNDGGTCVWGIESTPYPNLYTLPPTSVSPVLSADADDCGSGTTTLTTATTITINCSTYENLSLEFDNDWNAIGASDQAIVDYSTNGGTSWNNLITWGGTDVRNTHEVKPMPLATGMANVKVRFKSVQPGWDWWWAIDNVCILGSQATGITQNGNNVPTEYALSQNYPNPFNPTTNIKFDLPKQGFVSLKVYDVVGKEVAILVNEVKSPGSYNVDFNGTELSSGVYFYRLEADNFVDVKRMVLIK
ncbi:T9SS type A sorting domain-containing protein [Bacteroidota bacterium]